MKKRIVSLTLIMILILMAVPTAGFAASDTSLSKQRETEHFILCTAKGDSAALATLDYLEQELEGCYLRLTSKMQKAPSTKTRVNVFPNVTAFSECIRETVYPWWENWRGGIGLGEHVPVYVNTADGLRARNQIYISDPEQVGVAVHEFAHVVVDADLPKYLSEGMADYLAGTDYTARIIHDVLNKKTPTLATVFDSNPPMEDPDYAFPYVYGSEYVRFVEKEFGFDRVLQLVNGKPRESVLGMTDSKLNDMWTQYLNQHYGATKRTDDFAFFCDDADVGVIEDIEKTLNKVNEDLGLKRQGQPTVIRILPDIESVHQYFGWTDVDDSWVMDMRGRQLTMVTPRNSGSIYNYDGILNYAAYSYTVCTLRELYPDLSPYLWRGLAQYEAQFDNASWLADWVEHEMANHRQPHLEELSSFADETQEAEIYGRIFVEFVAQNHGFDVVRELLSGRSLAAITGASDAALEEQWQTYLHSEFAPPHLKARREPTVVQTGQGNVATGLTADGTNTAQKAVDLFISVPRHPIVVRPTDGETRDSLIGTGAEVQLLDRDNNIIESVILAVAGDVTGSGTVTLSDIVRIAGAFTGTTPLDGYWAVAADVNQSGKLDLTDLVLCTKLMRREVTGNPASVTLATIKGQDYECEYLGAADLSDLDWGYKERRFWSVKDAYEDFRENTTPGDVLPFSNYPNGVQPIQGQVFFIEYTLEDGRKRINYYRSDGNTWEGLPTTEQFVVD